MNITLIRGAALCVLALCVQIHALAATRAQAAPAGCKFGPRGGLHCTTVRVERTTREQRAAEERRLRRECAGRPNAGACAGYAR